MELAQNQMELSRQIEELAGTVDAQGRLLARLLERLDAGGGPASARAGEMSPSVRRRLYLSLPHVSLRNPWN